MSGHPGSRHRFELPAAKQLKPQSIVFLGFEIAQQHRIRTQVLSEILFLSTISTVRVRRLAAKVNHVSLAASRQAKICASLRPQALGSAVHITQSHLPTLRFFAQSLVRCCSVHPPSILYASRVLPRASVELASYVKRWEGGATARHAFPELFANWHTHRKSVRILAFSPLTAARMWEEQRGEEGWRGAVEGHELRMCAALRIGGEEETAIPAVTC
eukprot:6204782-Pleurochrysis_carterae.AAC.1